jgi:small subunit ribosomal protein S6
MPKKTKDSQRAYRATLVLDLRGVTDAPDAVVERLKDTFRTLEAKVGDVRNLGQRDFARVVDRRFPAGIYVQFEVKGSAALPVAFREKVRLDKTVNRVLFQSV